MCLLQTRNRAGQIAPFFHRTTTAVIRMFFCSPFVCASQWHAVVPRAASKHVLARAAGGGESIDKIHLFKSLVFIFPTCTGFVDGCARFRNTNCYIPHTAIHCVTPFLRESARYMLAPHCRGQGVALRVT